MDQQLIDVHSYTFRTEEDCENLLMSMRWSNGFCCPRCDYHEAFNIRTRRLLECKECRIYAHEFNGIRLNLFQMVRDSVTDFINHSNHELVEGTPQTVLNQNSPKDWDLHSYIESKINSQNSKLTIRGMLLNNNQRYVYNRVQSGKGSLGLFNKWIKTLVSIHLYPTFLKCFQVPA
jgi:hypothetical protein